MGLLSRLLGKPDRDDFAQMMLRSYREAGETQPIEYMRDEFMLKCGDHRGYLDNAYQEYCSAPRSRRKAVVQHWTKVWFSVSRDLDLSFEQAAPKLLPRIRERMFYEEMKQRSDGEFQPAYKLLTEQLAVCVVIDLPAAIAEISGTHLKEWNKSLDECLKIARENLWKISNEDFESPREGIYISPWRDNHDCSRLYLHDLIWQLKVKGEHVAMVPNRDVLIVTGSGDAKGLEAMAELTAAAFEQPRFMSARPVRLDGTKWTEFELPKDHPLSSRFKFLEVLALGSDYAAQKQLLDKRHEESGQDVHVADYHGVEHSESHEVFSYCVWPRADALLPKTDRVSFFDSQLPKDSQIVATVEWSTCLQIAGRLMEAHDIYPPRYRVREFPTAQEMEKLKAADRSIGS